MGAGGGGAGTANDATQGGTERKGQGTQPTHTRRKSEGTGRCMVYPPMELPLIPFLHAFLGTGVCYRAANAPDSYFR
jgi:hypothetical protein